MGPSMRMIADLMFGLPDQTAGQVRDDSAALIDGSTLWMATEAVNAPCETVTGCPGRDTFVNWGTVVGRIDLEHVACA